MPNNQPTYNLTADSIASPELWQLYMRISPEKADVMLYNPYEDNSLIYRSFPLVGENTDSDSPMRALENIVYDNPLLLSGTFHSARIIVDTPHVALTPTECGHCRELFDLTFPLLDDNTAIESTELRDTGATITWGMDKRMSNFVRRTFADATVTHTLETLTAWCRSKAPGSSVKAFAVLRDNTLLLTILSASQFLFATRFETRTPDDASFYILSAIEAAGQPVEEILIAGENTVRQPIIESLRRFHHYVMPMIFPSEMHRAGAGKADIPFDLLILPLTR